MNLRKSLQDISFMVRDIPYPGKIPEELKHLHCYIADGGHSILVVPKPFLSRAIEEGCDMFETPLPVKYVLTSGWERIPGTDSVCVDVEYSDELGALVPDGYEEF